MCVCDAFRRVAAASDVKSYVEKVIISTPVPLPQDRYRGWGRLAIEVGICRIVVE